LVQQGIPSDNNPESDSRDHNDTERVVGMSFEYQRQGYLSLQDTRKEHHGNGKFSLTAHFECINDGNWDAENDKLACYRNGRVRRMDNKPRHASVVVKVGLPKT
jgi:hypothetical protein